MNPTAKHGQRIGIIGAMEAEVALLRDSLNGLEIHRFGKNFVVYTGQFAGKDIALCQSGIGKVNAAIATTLLKEHFAPDVVINTGSAGGIGGGLKVGDVVVGTHIMLHDVDVTAFGYQHGQVPQLPAAFACDESLVAAAEKAACTLFLGVQAAFVMFTAPESSAEPFAPNVSPPLPEIPQSSRKPNLPRCRKWHG